MSRQRYTDEFKAEAVKQVTERGHRVAEVAARLGMSQHSLNQWFRAGRWQGGAPPPQSDELRRLKAELKREAEERDILKRAGAIQRAVRWTRCPMGGYSEAVVRKCLLLAAKCPSP